MLQELVQNAEDAGASEVKFFYDKHSHPTACLFDEELAQFQVQLSFKAIHLLSFSSSGPLVLHLHHLFIEHCHQMEVRGTKGKALTLNCGVVCSWVQALITWVIALCWVR